MKEITATDPVCGMGVDPSAEKPTFDHHGTTYHFCSDGCRERFVRDPNGFLGDEPANQERGQAGNETDSTVKGEHICPMHPEVRQESPGDCPDCGMALEPVDTAAPATRIEYTCPMHPEVVQDSPGECPKCGMALEPRTVDVEEGEENPELRGMRRRFWVSLCFSLPLFVVAMGGLIPGVSFGWLASPRGLRNRRDRLHARIPALYLIQC